MRNVFLLVVTIALIVVLVAAIVIFVRRQIDAMTLGTFRIDSSGRASYNGVFEFERSPEDIRDRKWILMRVESTDLTLPNERNRRNDSSYYGGFTNSEERGNANER